MQDKYMAYVGSYSYNGQAKGITVYDVDEKKGKFIYRCEVEVDNSSYLTVSHDGRMLYSIADEGVVAFPDSGKWRTQPCEQRKYQGDARLPYCDRCGGQVYLRIRLS